MLKTPSANRTKDVETPEMLRHSHNDIVLTITRASNRWHRRFCLHLIMDTMLSGLNTSLIGERFDAFLNAPCGERPQEGLSRVRKDASQVVCTPGTTYTYNVQCNPEFEA